MEIFGWIVLFLVASAVLVYRRSSMLLSAGVFAALVLLVSFLGHMHTLGYVLLTTFYVLFFVPLAIKPLRRQLLTRGILTSFRKVMPEMSKTEQQALEAGTVGWTGDLFSGNPSWEKLHQSKGPSLSAEEQTFLDGPVEQLCQMLNDWKISRSMLVPESIWTFLKDEGFFGMIIPKRFGGKQFSAMAHSEVLAKISGVCIAVTVSVGVPNSLGPAELLLHYGTDEQQQHYLPRLAKGDDIPCFALTSPRAGSDAGAIEDHGIVCEEIIDGEKQLCIRLNWNKRYITLAPVATLLGLAFKLYDPDHLLGSRDELGITCALIPTDTKNVVTGRRHYPLDSAFPNGPTQGHDVVIPLSGVIGGRKMIGQGWRMLMECLAVGRSISLPSTVTGGAKRATLCGGAYARIRRQFHMYIGRFEGIQAPLARMAAHTYTMDALRRFTISAVDNGEKPVVESAIGKYHTTELARKVTMDAMDVHGGKAICMGPNNYMAQGYMELPISLTVEGANILTRSMIIFGQGAIRCHPYVLAELKAASNQDREKSLLDFDAAVFGHAGFLISNQLRALVAGVTGGRLLKAPKGPLKRYYQQFSRFSACLALLSDFSMLTLGGNLKRMEFLSARLGDLLSYTYIGSAVLKHHNLADSDTQKAELPVIHWICQDLLCDLQNAMHEFLLNFPNPLVARMLRWHVLPLGRRLNRPSDRLTTKVAALLLEPSAFRKHLATNTYQTKAPNNVIKKMDDVLEQAIAVEPLIKKVAIAKRKNQINGMTYVDLIHDAVKQSVLTNDEGKQMLATNDAKMEIINVDDFSPEEIARQFSDIKSTVEGL